MPLASRLEESVVRGAEGFDDDVEGVIPGLSLSDQQDRGPDGHFWPHVLLQKKIDAAVTFSSQPIDPVP